ncbi:hypothetical protein C922_04603 [Plasmodium inui San Antonio 1]|uniref:EMP1-trafficking protein n=1 Tax=Plasmodium inui San Antonio 1 TaxID=1237626 RepID=W7A081_9APIC|nr:hypothetical protein C922_04603 [Plasmodium inui San Antonio 1]EUD64975.1 hypothetical protein C922_04603 [Plasmodium inui San Antonio 1]
MFLKNKEISSIDTMSYRYNILVDKSLRKADANVLTKDQPKKEVLNSIFFYSKIFAFTLLIWASQCSYSHTNFSSSHDEVYTAGIVENAAFNRCLASNKPRGNNPPNPHGSYMSEGANGQQSPSTSQGAPPSPAPQQAEAGGAAPSELNIDIEQKLKDLKDVIWDKVENAVEWGTLSDNVKGYLGKIDLNLESKILDEVNKANRNSNLMEIPDCRTQIINSFSQNYTIITPPLLLLILSILTSDRCKKHLANVLLTSVLVTLTYIFFKLKKIDDIKKQSANADQSHKNDSGYTGKKAKDKTKSARD